MLPASLDLTPERLKRLDLLHRTGHIRYETHPNPATPGLPPGPFHNGLVVTMMKSTRLALRIMREVGFRPRPWPKMVVITRRQVEEYGAP